MRYLGIFLVLSACGDDPPPSEECRSDGDVTLSVAQTQGGSSLADGSTIIFGDGLQTGGIFVPLYVRVAGVEGEQPVMIRMLGRVNGELVGIENYTQQLLCSNNPDFAGTFLGAGLHLRVGNRMADELDGETIELQITLQDVNDQTIGVEVLGTLSYDASAG